METSWNTEGSTANPYSALYSSLGIETNLSSILTLAFVGLVTVFASLFAYLCYTPSVDTRSPAFTTDTSPLVGSWGFITRKWPFWKNCLNGSKTGNFSFWLGKHHVVGVSGDAARKMFLDHHDLDFIAGAALVGHGPDLVPPIHEIFNPSFHNGRSYFQRRLLDLQKTEQLSKHLSDVARDVRSALEEMGNSANGVINPSKACYGIVVKQGCRVVCTDEISDSPPLLDRLVSILTLLMSTTSLHTVALPWYPSWARLKRRYGRYILSSLVSPIVSKRMASRSLRKNDALQMFIDNGDSKEFIVNFFISILFIATANAGVMTGSMLNIVSHFPEWQEKIYDEVRTAAAAYSTEKNAPLVDQLDSVPLEAWESSFPSVEPLYKEAIRMWVAFPMIRRNMSDNCIPIPGSKEVIPAGTFASYNTVDVHYNEDIYPNPTTYDPDRFVEGREEYKKQTYGFVGWGQGRHPCMGMRWAKVQQNMMLAYALAMYEWTGCDCDGNATSFDRKIDINKHAPCLPQGVYCKLQPRAAA